MKIISKHEVAYPNEVEDFLKQQVITTTAEGYKFLHVPYIFQEVKEGTYMLHDISKPMNDIVYELLREIRGENSHKKGDHNIFETKAFRKHVKRVLKEIIDGDDQKA